MKRTFTASLAIAASLVVGGCFAMDIDTTGLDPTVYLTRDGVGDLERGARFETETRASWLFWGLSELGEPDVDGVIWREIQREGGTAVVDVEIVTQRTFLDGLIMALTFGIYGQRTVFVSGTVVR